MARDSTDTRHTLPITNHGFGRGDRIRTCDILLPKQARYRAALRPDTGIIITYTMPYGWRTGKQDHRISLTAISLSGLLVKPSSAQTECTKEPGEAFDGPLFIQEHPVRV